MAIDTEAIAYHVKGILKALGEDPEREGLKETPERVARMYAFSKPETDAGQTVVTMKDISVFSYCEHHMALMYDMHVNVSYVPHGKVLGLSKVARICDLAAKRLQLQERLGQDIAEIIMEAAGTPDVGVVITGSHSCMTARGIRNVPAVTTTTTFCGAYETDVTLQQRVMN